MSRMSSDHVEMEDVSLDSRLMISVKNAWKTYSGSDYILQDLSMSVPKGQIYSLLGSSGTGKTTLLKCVTGNSTLCAGHIEVNVNSRLQIGYMPQELALYSDLTLAETFLFFGIILNMTKKEREASIENLTKLLQLPPGDTQISSLSGGQQRRISVAVAMMNNPDLLILDEPTVNLDTLLKQSIWNYLHKITKEDKKTILLTTHYIEEARNSDKVGFMGNGRILFEGSPEEALNRTEPPSERLEEVYYQLCYQERTDEQAKQPPQTCEPSSKLYEEFSSFSFRRVRALFLKTMVFVKRNILFVYLFIFSPVFMTAIMASAFDRPRDIKIGYVNYEDQCSSTSDINCSTLLSCRYLKNLKERDFKLVEYDTVDDGKEAVRRNEVWAMVRFNWNFSVGVTNRLDYFYAAEHVEIAEDDEARVWLDMSSYPISFMIKKHFYDSFLKSIEEWYTDCGWNSRAARPILRVENPIYGKIEESLVSTGIPKVVIMMIFSVGVAIGMMFVLGDRELGTFERCRVSGLKTSELVVSAFMTCFMFLLPIGIALLLIFYLYTGPRNAPVVWVALLLYLQAATGILAGSFLGLVSKTVATALQVTCGILHLLLYVSGMMWPIEAAHWLVRVIFNVFPTLIPAQAITVMSIKGLDVSELCWGLADSLVWLMTTVTAIYIVIRRKEKS